MAEEWETFAPQNPQVRWRDISSAPTEGQDILGYVEEYEKVWPVYCDEEEGTWKRFDGDRIPKPSMWMPMPAPPEKNREPSGN